MKNKELENTLCNSLNRKMKFNIVPEKELELYWDSELYPLSVNRNILLKYLDGTKRKRIIAYQKLDREWDLYCPEIGIKLEQLWEQYKEKNCLQLIALLADESILVKHIAEFPKLKYYKSICEHFYLTGKKSCIDLMELCSCCDKEQIYIIDDIYQHMNKEEKERFFQEFQRENSKCKKWISKRLKENE